MGPAGTVKGCWHPLPAGARTLPPPAITKPMLGSRQLVAEYGVVLGSEQALLQGVDQHRGNCGTHRPESGCRALRMLLWMQRANLDVLEPVGCHEVFGKGGWEWGAVCRVAVEVAGAHHQVGWVRGLGKQATAGAKRLPGPVDQRQELLDVEVLDHMERGHHVHRSGRESMQVLGTVPWDHLESSGPARIDEPLVAVDPVRWHTPLAQQREPLSATGSHVDHPTRAHQTMDIGQIDLEATGDLLLGASKPVLEGGIQGRKPPSGTARLPVVSADAGSTQRRKADGRTALTEQLAHPVELLFQVCDPAQRVARGQSCLRDRLVQCT